MDAKRFEEIRNNIVGAKRVRQGIGTLQEKTVHAVLKDYYAPDKDMQEIRVSGYVADIYTGGEIIEIQTSNFHTLRGKLDAFLPNYPVTLVYPIPKIKYLIWMDEETGKCSKPRKSNAKGSVYRAFYELYKIKPYLSDENLHLCFPLLELEEYRLLNGWSRDRKRGSQRFDRIPAALLGEVRIDDISDYAQLIPEGIEEPFTVQEFGKAVGQQRKIAAKVIHVLHYLHVIERCENRGRAYTYRTVKKG
ncbi:MAG: hypothetical protein K2N55_03015 [Lachnospiraceae bacterium]|nr:hypothetical protein [Lachnospiraceae bacterium]